MGPREDAVHHLLLDPEFWKPRLHRLDTPPQLVRLPRADLERPGVEVCELRLRAHDGTRLQALLARSALHRRSGSVRLRTCCDFETCAIDYDAVERGATDVVFPPPEGRRLEDRVLDVLRLARILAHLEDVEPASLELYSGCQTPPDEFRIAEMVRGCGWS